MRHFKLSVITLGLISFVASPAIAEDNSKLVVALQQQMTTMQHQIDAIKNHSKKQIAAKPKSHRAPVRQVRSADTPVELTPAEVQAEKIDAAAPKVGIIGPNNLPQAGLTYLPIDLDVPGQSFVSTGPYLGVPLSYSGSNLIINTPSINEDVSLLKLRKNINTRLEALGIQHPEDHAHLLLSGTVEGEAFYKSRGNNSNTSDIDLTNVELDGYILGPSSWTSGLFSMSYENDIGSATGSVATNHRTFNSRVFINKAFITIGDFTKTPLYGTIGQMYVPFGTYSTNMIASPMTKAMFRTKARAILVGFQQQAPNAIYASAYAFQGDSHPGSRNNINNGGINGGFKYDTGKFSGDIGGGVIGNIADSVGMQFTGNKPSWDGFGSTATICGPTGTSACGNENLVHAVAGYDFRGTLNVGKWDFLAEYIIASTSFSPNDLTFNSRGARPQAFNTELAYTFTMFNDKPTSVAAGYGFTKQALALGLPLHRYAVVVNTSWWRNTLESIELRHDRNYSRGSTATGSGVAAAPGTGSSDNTITAQMDIYF